MAVETRAGRFSAASLSARAVLNAAAGGLDAVARLAVGLVLNPLLVSGLGVFGFGLWQTLRQLLGAVSPATGRPSHALRWTLASLQSSDDDEHKRRQVGSAVAVWALFLPVLVAVGGCLTWFAPVWLDVPSDQTLVARVVTALLAINLIATSLMDLPRSVLGGQNMDYKRMGLSALLLLAGGGLTALALHLNLGLIGVAACPLIVSLGNGLLFLQVARANVPWFGIARPGRAAVRAFLGVSGWFLAWHMVMRVMRASDLVVLGMVDSVEHVTAYAITRYVPEALLNLIAIFVLGIAPGLGGIIGAGDLARARALRAEMMALTWLVASASGVAIVAWNQSFVGLWIGPEHYSGSLANVSILVMMSQFALIRNDAQIIDLTLDLRAKVWLGAASTALALTLAAVLAGPMDLGIPGLCLGFIAGRAPLSVAYPWLVGRRLGLSIGEQLRSLVRPACGSALLIAAALAGAAHVAAESWLALILSVAATGAAALVIALFVGLPPRVRRRVLHRLRVLQPGAGSPR